VLGGSLPSWVSGVGGAMTGLRVLRPTMWSRWEAIFPRHVWTRGTSSTHGSDSAILIGLSTHERRNNSSCGS
jgi:hypothetical protein